MNREFQDTVKALLSSLQDPADQKSVSEVQETMSSWLESFEKYVDLEQAKMAADKIMVEEGKKAEEEIEKMRHDQSDKLREESNNKILAGGLESRIDKVNESNRLLKLILQTRRYEKNFILRHDTSYLKKVESGTKEILSLISDMRKRFRDPANLAQADVIISATKKYAEAIGNYIQKVKVQEKEDAHAISLAKALGEKAKSLEEGQHEKMTAMMTLANSMMIIMALSGLFIGVILAIVITKGITKPLGMISKAAEGLSVGDIEQEVEIQQKDEIGHLAEAFRSMIVAQKEKAQVAEQIAKGNLSVDIEVMSSKDILGKSMETMRDAIKRLTVDVGQLVESAVAGNLSNRADASIHHGDYQRIILGINETLDAVIGPLQMAASYVERISKGDIPERNIQSYNGDFNTIKENLNQCGDAIRLLIQDADTLSRAALEGKLATRADASRHNGDFQKVIKGVNDTLDAVIGPLNVAANYVDRISRGDIPQKLNENYAGDFNLIKNNLNQCIEAVDLLVREANDLANAAVEGRLSTRGNAQKHNGDFKKIVQGVNMTLDAVLDPINEAADILGQLASYNLTARVKGDYKGDHAKIKDSLNATANSLHEAMSQVSDASEQVSSAAQQISSSSQQVAEGASEQASSLEETSSSLEEMASMTKRNADNTHQARALAEETQKYADKGAGAMEKMMDAMKKIKTSSESTAAIIKDINDIAFQTNLLALNAAVEAARAGDAGRGFAVVAEEVRNLAGRAKEAARNTEELIKESVSLADNGQLISGEAADNLKEIVNSVSKVTGLVGEINVASQEQAKGIEQVNKAVSEMDAVVQQAAANSEESSSAAEELAAQSEELTLMVQKFELKKGHVLSNWTNDIKGVKKTKITPKEKAMKPHNVRSEQELLHHEAIPSEDTDLDFAEF
jgi:methyl-accepting chemotaxis protein